MITPEQRAALYRVRDIVGTYEALRLKLGLSGRQSAYHLIHKSQRMDMRLAEKLSKITGGRVTVHQLMMGIALQPRQRSTNGKKGN